MAQLNLGRVKGKSAYEVAVDNGFIGTETDWLNSIKGERGMVPIIDPATDKWTVVYQTEIPNNNIDIPTVNPTDNHWYVGQVDTGIENSSGMKAYISPYTNNWCFGFQTTVSAQGRSITSISTDSNNNVNVIFSDGTSSVVGTLTINVQADFLTSAGFGNMRYDTTTGKFQYTQNGGTTWNDIMMTFQNNTYIMNMIPQACKKVIGSYNKDTGYNEVTLIEPDDTYIDGQVACVVDKIVIVKKQNVEPIDINDGTTVTTIKRSQFGIYSNDAFEDNSFKPNIGEIWYYKAFPVSTNGFSNTQSDNTAKILIKDYTIYGFEINQSESDPFKRVSYNINFNDANFGSIPVDNKLYNSAYMDYVADSFNYGSWRKAFFMPKPCLLKQTGAVWKYLDSNNYSLFEDGTDATDYINGTKNSDDDNSILNVMIQFPKIYIKYQDNQDNTVNVYIANKKVDNTFHCWAWHDMNGKEINYTYISAYRGYFDGTYLRSLSDKKPMHSQNAQNEVLRAETNNISQDKLWNTNTFSDYQFINTLLILIGKSTDSQTVFGNGHYTGGTNDNSLINSGKANANGLFYGTNKDWTVVKVFGIEHWWGNQWNRTAGCINDRGTYKIKMTYSNIDGSTTTGYNFDGTGYISAGKVPDSNGSFITKMYITNYGLLPSAVGGNSNTHYADSMYSNSNRINYLSVGCPSHVGQSVGAFTTNLNDDIPLSNWQLGASLTCRPISK